MQNNAPTEHYESFARRISAPGEEELCSKIEADFWSVSRILVDGSKVDVCNCLTQADADSVTLELNILLGALIAIKNRATAATVTEKTL